jgi:outer membrane protein OmpA-like peptidoglycan-associated protein
MPEGKPTIENQADVETPEHESAHSGAPSGAPIPPMVVLGFVIIALLGGLVAIALRGGFSRSSSDPVEVARLKAETNALQNQLNRNRLELGLRPLEGGAESIDDVAARLKKEADTMVMMASSLEKLLTESEARNRATESKLLQSETSRQNLAADSVRMQEEIRRALVTGSEADLLRRDLTTAKARNDALMAELDQTRKELAAKGEGASKEDLADMQRRLEEALRARDFFEAKVKELQAELSNTKSKLFAASENELLPAAVELFRSLRKLEGLPDAEISAAYSKLGVELGANVLRKLDFATGSSKLSAADDEAIRALVRDIPDGDLILCVGYASETGNVDSNRTLSSDRATTAAELYSGAKRPEQAVQAVYLGQTDRFSSRIPERNQIVEIWHIRKK